MTASAFRRSIPHFTIRLGAVGLVFLPMAGLPYVQEVSGSLWITLIVVELVGLATAVAELSSAFVQFDEHGIKRPFLRQLAWADLESTSADGNIIIFHFRSGRSLSEVRVRLSQFTTPRKALEMFREWAGESEHAPAP